MATTSSIKFRDNPQALKDTWVWSKKSDETIAQGDLLENSSGDAQVVDGADNTVFLGVALAGRESDDDRDVPIAFRCVIEAKVVSTSDDLTAGDAVYYSAGANGTTWEFTKGTAEGIAWALEDISAGDTGNFLIDVMAIQASTLFDTVTT